MRRSIRFGHLGKPDSQAQRDRASAGFRISVLMFNKKPTTMPTGVALAGTGQNVERDYWLIKSLTIGFERKEDRRDALLTRLPRLPCHGKSDALNAPRLLLQSSDQR